MPMPTKFKRMDVRPLLARGEMPLPEIRRQVDALKSGQGLLLLALFPPTPFPAVQGGGRSTAPKRLVHRHQVGVMAST